MMVLAGPFSPWPGGKINYSSLAYAGTTRPRVTSTTPTYNKVIRPRQVHMSFVLCPPCVPSSRPRPRTTPAPPAPAPPLLIVTDHGTEKTQGKPRQAKSALTASAKHRKPSLSTPGPALCVTHHQSFHHEDLLTMRRAAGLVGRRCQCGFVLLVAS